ncbi:hypothetical protein [Neptuniibacter sp. QD48_11]|uniref:hypothetical protein n=1 Tax=Neptuniibacter sp. QD48_11 TaxID=3398211 RepID=UPI0039F4C6ED
MIKNWTVKTKQIKKKTRIKKDGKVVKTINSSAFKYGCYLLNKKAQSHYHTNIIDLNKAPQRLAQINAQITSRKLHRQAAGLRGGGINCEATSFVLSLPKDIKQPTPKEWQKIAMKVVKSLEEPTGISANELWQQCVAVLHEEPSKDKNNHLNLMIGNVHDNEYCKALTQHRSTYAVKRAFNQAMLELGIDHMKYLPQKSKIGDKPLYAARAEKLKQQEELLKAKEKKIHNKISNLNILKLEVEELLSSFRHWLKAFKNRAVEESIELAEQIEETSLYVKNERPDILEELAETAEEIELQDTYLRTVQNEEKAHHRLRKRRRRKRRP